MDTGKGIAFMSKQERSLWDFEDIEIGGPVQIVM